MVLLCVDNSIVAHDCSVLPTRLNTCQPYVKIEFNITRDFALNAECLAYKTRMQKTKYIYHETSVLSYNCNMFGNKYMSL